MNFWDWSWKLRFLYECLLSELVAYMMFYEARILLNGSLIWAFSMFRKIIFESPWSGMLVSGYIFLGQLLVWDLPHLWNNVGRWTDLLLFCDGILMAQSKQMHILKVWWYNIRWICVGLWMNCRLRWSICQQSSGF